MKNTRLYAAAAILALLCACSSNGTDASPSPTFTTGPQPTITPGALTATPLSTPSSGTNGTGGNGNSGSADMNKVGDDIKNTADDIGGAVKNGADAVGDAVGGAVDKVTQ